MSKYEFSVVTEKDSDGCYAFCPELQGCYTQGDTSVVKISRTRFLCT
ncbi:MAG: type II toxin-antitoxin system HicB family antitoxin [Candidatus Magnetominusculus sp. LBB02]|nr:type II toxin-antitoxin system HicB family antitoxin [Candidatus Magnetominusculus sp. LBB02]